MNKPRPGTQFGSQRSSLPCNFEARRPELCLPGDFHSHSTHLSPAFNNGPTQNNFNNGPTQDSFNNSPASLPCLQQRSNPEQLQQRSHPGQLQQQPRRLAQ